MECSPALISGISSSTTTYSIAPAAKDSRYGIAGTTSPATITVSAPKTGSTAPERTPSKNDLGLLFPSANSGMEMIAPSGKFWIAIPSAKASAPPAVMFEEPESSPA